MNEQMKRNEIMDLIQKEVLSDMYKNTGDKKFLSDLFTANVFNDDSFLLKMKAKIAIYLVRYISDILITSINVEHGVNILSKVPAELDDIEYRLQITGNISIEYHTAIPGGGYNKTPNKLGFNIDVPYDIPYNDKLGINGVIYQKASFLV